MYHLETAQPSLALHEVRTDNPKPRVLVIALQSGKNADGGLESLTQLVEHYRATHLHLITQVETRKTQRWRRAGHCVTILPLPYHPGGKAGGGAWGTVLRVWTHLRWNLAIAWLSWQNRIEVAHVNDPHALWHSAFGLRLLNVPVLYNIRDTKPRLSRSERIKWRFGFSLTSRQVVLSREMASRWCEALFNSSVPGSLSYVYSIVESRRQASPTTEEKQAARERLGLARDARLVGYVASFSPKKAQLKFIESAGPLLEHLGPGSQVLFVGDFLPGTDDYSRTCLEAHSKLNLGDRVRFCGYQSAMTDWYLALDLVLVATENEGLARCMIEALAQGTPVISFDVSSAREILEVGECGRVVSHGDYLGLLEAARIALANQPILRRWSANGIRLSNQLFSPEENAAAYERTYRALSS
ncbi:MAG: glycosyltransferase family 4 protein [Opitutaceae bacterium]|nr:glycosyltransferase family 4 protein [Opitutaceae bacterium]